MKLKSMLLTLLTVGSMQIACAAAPLEHKGIDECNDAPSRCIVFRVNAKTKIESGVITQERERVQPARTTPSEVISHPVSMDISFRYSGPSGTGKQGYLIDKTTLKTGDKFVTDVRYNDDGCLSVVHFDAHGQLNELVSLTGYENCQKAGTILTLPAPNKHFRLDHNVGDETFHMIVSKQPLPKLMGTYKTKLEELDNAKLSTAIPPAVAARFESKGLLIGDDEQPSAEQPEHLAVCLAGEHYCRSTFMIHHVAR